jgi:hypothetical protein
MLPSYRSSTDKIEGSSYFSKDWVKGSVTTTDNNVFSKNLLFMFDKVNNTLYYKKQDSSMTWKVDINKLSAFNLITDQPHIFMKADFFTKDHPGEFFEVLLLDEKKYSFLKRMETSFEQPPVNRAAQAMTESISSGRYVDKVSYFIFNNGTLTEVELKKKSFPNAMNADEDKAETYIKNHNGNFNESYVITMLTDINEQIK